MEGTMKKRGFKKILASVAAATLILASASSMMTASALVQRIPADFQRSFHHDYTWHADIYNPGGSKASSRVDIYMSPGQTASWSIRMTGTTSSKTGRGDFSSVSSEQWKQGNTVKLDDQYATSLNMSATRYYSNGTSMQYDTYYYE